MSVLNTIKSASNNNNKKSWTVEDVKLAIGLKLLGATRKQICEVTGHSTNSITYVMTRRFKSDEALSEYTGFTSPEEYKQYAQDHLSAEQDEAAATA